METLYYPPKNILLIYVGKFAPPNHNGNTSVAIITKFPRESVKGVHFFDFSAYMQVIDEEYESVILDMTDSKNNKYLLFWLCIFMGNVSIVVSKNNLENIKILLSDYVNF
jgi:hypothetical protein